MAPDLLAARLHIEARVVSDGTLVTQRINVGLNGIAPPM